jgi:hypothetical protein
LLIAILGVFHRIYVAGGKEYEMEKIRIKEGVPANPNLQKNLRIM